MIEKGKWLSRGGGGLDIKSIDGNCFSGLYNSKLGAVDASDCFNAVGYINGRLIGFTVLWRNENFDAMSITSWNGRFIAKGEEVGFGDSQKDRLELQWILHRLKKNVRENPQDIALWEGTLHGMSILYKDS